MALSSVMIVVPSVLGFHNSTNCVVIGKVVPTKVIAS
jgi:hypothetical protein